MLLKRVQDETKGEESESQRKPGFKVTILYYKNILINYCLIKQACFV